MTWDPLLVEMEYFLFFGDLEKLSFFVVERRYVPFPGTDHLGQLVFLLFCRPIYPDSLWMRTPNLNAIQNIINSLPDFCPFYLGKMIQNNTKCPK